VQKPTADILQNNLVRIVLTAVPFCLKLVASLFYQVAHVRFDVCIEVEVLVVAVLLFPEDLEMNIEYLGN
jgi:hypothetical protein